MKLIWLFLLLISASWQISSQKLITRQGQILVEVEKASTPIRSLQVLQNEFGHLSNFEMSQVIANPMNVWKIEFDFSKVSERLVLETVKEIGSVYTAQLNHIINYRKLPNDAQLSAQWQYLNTGLNGGLENADLDIDDAWEIATGGITASGDTIVACIIDDGLDPAHEDFEGNIWVNRFEIPDNGIDDDQNGYVDDYLGWDAYNDNSNIYEGGVHGTPVTGIVGAKGNNEIGVSGVNWDLKLMIVRGGGDEANALASYAYPYIMRKKYNETNGAEGAFVVTTNASWGTDFGQPEDAPLWCNFYDSLGMVGIISSGATINENVDVDIEGDLPTACSSEFLISVSNVDRTNNKANGAGFGKLSIDIGAFGSEVYTTESVNDYGDFGGTSGASPHVAGAVALIYSLPYPELMELAKSNPAEAARLVKVAIMQGAKKGEQFEDLFVSSGVLNLKNSFAILNSIFSECPFPLSIEVSQNNLDSLIVSWDESENAVTYDLRYKLESSEDWIETNDVSSPFTISTIDTCGMYEIQIRSNCEMDTSSDYSFSKLFTTLGCCLAPDGLDFSNDPDFVEENTILVSWADHPDYEAYVVDYKLADEALWLSDTVFMNEHIIDSLLFCSAYDIRVKAFCITGDETEFSEILEAVTACGNCTILEYCPPPAIVTFGEWIESISIDGQVAITGNNGGYVNNSGYFDIDLNIGSELPFQLDKGFDGGTFTEWVKVWVDLNIDGEFSEEELVYDEGTASVEDIVDTIFLDDVIGRGYTLMRVAMVFVDEPVACIDDDFDGAFGEYEDYCVRLVGPCDYGLSIESIVADAAEAVVNFTMVDTSIAYNVRYRKVEETEEDWTTISVIDTFAQLSDLEECTPYLVQVRAVCDVDTSGFMSVEDTFVTGGVDCMVPTIDIEEAEFDLQAFPNPFVGDLWLKIESEISDQVVIDVLNMNGQILERFNDNISTGENRVQINGSDTWPAGVYFVRLRTNQSEKSIKVIKLAD